MKINNIGPSGINPYKKAEKLFNAAKSEQKTDKVEISSAAKELQQSNSVVSERLNKIEALKQQVQSGTYNMDPEATAKSIIDFYSK